MRPFTKERLLAKLEDYDRMQEEIQTLRREVNLLRSRN